MPRDCDLARLTAELAARFRPLPDDPHVVDFIESGPRPHGRLRALAHRGLRRFASDYDVDGWLGTHPMCLFGEASWRELIGDSVGRRLLDVGAGSGDVTIEARALFQEILCLELSRPMLRRLRARGLEARRHDLSRSPLPSELGRFDVVALLDVLDRSERPLSLLAGAIDALAPRGLLVISVPLPARPHVDLGGVTVDPDEPIGGRGETFEEALTDLWSETLAPFAAETTLDLERIARAPYLSRGHGDDPLHVLDAGIFVLRARSTDRERGVRRAVRFGP